MALNEDICAAMEDYTLNGPGDWNKIAAEELKSSLDEGKPIFLLDVRDPAEYGSGHIVGAVNVPVVDLPSRVKELPQDRNIYMAVYCTTGRRSAYATMFLRVYGFNDVRTLKHGIQGWIAAGYPIV